MSQGVSIQVTVVGAVGPVNGAKVEAFIVVETGELQADQEESQWAWSNLDGEAHVLFSTGIRGLATFHFEVYANGVFLCISDSYFVATGPKLSLHLVESSTPTCGSSAPPNATP